MFIGEVSKISGATVKAIRLYEKLGLLANIPRENSYRIFTEEHVLLIKFIKIAQRFDFKLLELKHIIHSDGELADWQNIEKAIALKESLITKEIIRLKSHKNELKHYRSEIKQCLIDNSNCTFPHVKN